MLYKIEVISIIMISVLWAIEIKCWDYVEDDMLLSESQVQLLYRAGPIARTRNGLLWQAYRWPNRILYYNISNIFLDHEKRLIMEAMQEISSKSCIRFQRADTSCKAYVKVERLHSGCSSWVGWQGHPQTLNLATGCMYKGIIQHELLHALGFYHQQSDPNRDNYVSILSENIQQGKEHNFIKYSSNIVSDFGVGYDFESILHYNAFAFSKNGKPTIIPFAQNVHLGQRKEPSKKDLLKLNRMYDC